MVDHLAFCEKCFSAKELISTVREHGIIIPYCPICHSRNVHALSASDELLKRIFRALVRLNYSEWEYNGKIGGEHLSYLLFGKNEIMNLDSTADELEFDSALTYIEDAWYPKDEKYISLGGGYWDFNVISGVKHNLDLRLTRILAKAFQQNYFELEKEVIQLLQSLKSDISVNLGAGRSYFRSRIGVKKRLKPTLHNFDPDYYYVPFTGKDICAPPLYLTSEGRLNRSRVSILYLASDRETAVAEVRPHPGHLVSTAEFRLKEQLCVADFTEKDVRNYLSDSRLETLRLIFSFNAVLNLPVPPEQREFYLLTQLLSDCIRQMGFEGVIFKSSVGTGHNLACFSPSMFILQDGSEMVMEVKALQYEFGIGKSPPHDSSDDDFEEDSNTPFGTLFELLDRQKKDAFA